MAKRPDKVKKDRRLRIIWSSNGPHTNSGYGVFTRDILFRMARDGWNVACNSFWGVQGYPVTLYGHDLIDDRFKDVRLRCYPKMSEDFGTDGLAFHGKDFGAHAFFSMCDVWSLNPQFLSQLPYYVPYVPIDKDPLPPGVGQILRHAHKIVSFSRFGQRVLEEAGFTSTLILEGTDPELFKPLDKTACRKELRLPENLFLFGMIAANKENPPRKGFQEALMAFKRFQDARPDSGLLVHTQQPSPTGFPVPQFAHHLGVDPKKVFYINDYQAIFKSDSHYIAKEMNAIDVLLHPSRTEGFGLTVIEAASCGTPAIVTNTTSMPEMIVDGVTGEICDTGWKWFTNDLSWTESADPESLYRKMESLYAKIKADPKKIAKNCRDHVLRNYDINRQYEELWVPLLEGIQKKILPAQ